MRKIFIVVMLIGLFGCGYNNEKRKVEDVHSDDVFTITINGNSYSGKDILSYSYFLLHEIDKEALKNDEIKKYIISSFTDHILLFNEAKKSGIEIEKRRVDEFLKKFDSNINNSDLSTFHMINIYDIQKIKNTIYENLVIQSYLNNLIYENIKVDKSELMQYYDTYIQQIEPKVLYHTWHIFIKDEKNARIAREKLRARNSFKSVAKEYSEDVYAENGGDMGYISLDEMPEDFKVIADMKVGTISEIIKSEYGYHIFSVRDKMVLKEKPSFDEISGEIYFKVFEKKQSKLVENIIKELRKNAKINIVGDINSIFESNTDSN